MSDRFVPGCSLEPLETRLLFAYVPPLSGRKDISLDDSWKFIRKDISGAQAITFNDSKWSNVSLPNTWNALDAQDGGNNYYQGIGWYRRHYTISSSLKGKQFYIKFDAAMLSTSVYVNGSLVGSHDGGYSAFTFDISPYVKVGADNVIAVKVDNTNNPNIAPFFSGFAPDWPKWGGLYRDVHLLATNPLSVNPLDFGSPGIFIKQSKVSSASAKLDITAEVRDGFKNSESATVQVIIVDKNGNIVKSIAAAPVTVKGKSTVKVSLSTTITNPHLWNGTIDPYRYKVYTQVLTGKTSSDIVAQFIGIRSFSVDPKKGFLLNGQPYALHGVAYYTDRLDQGSAVSASERAQDISTIVQMGATTVRLAHYQHASDEYDQLDAAGIIVWTEIPLDANFNTSSAFTSNITQQLKELIRQNYNHPSIAFLGLANELPATADGYNLVKTLQTIAKSENPAWITTVASNLFTDSDVLKFGADAPAFNKYYGWYEKTLSDFGPWLDSVHKNNPNDPIGVSEYGAGGSINQHEANPPKPTDTGTDFHPEEYEDKFHEAYLAALQSRPWVFGSWAWEMFDSASDWRNQGDTPGRVDKGLVTFDHKTKKDPFYLYQANWTNTPVLYITSRTWTDRPTAINDVKIYSNCDSVTLSINGHTISTLTPNVIKVATWANQTLRSGSNTITVTGMKNGQTFTDTVVWNVGTSAKPAAVMPKSLFSKTTISSPDDLIV